MKVTILYALYDAEDLEEHNPFYIGCGSEKRPYRRIHEGAKHGNLFMSAVLASHIERKVRPRVRVLEVFTNPEEAKDWERELILHYERRCDGSGVLCNMTRGREGPQSRHMTKEVRNKIGRHTKRMFQNEEFRNSFKRAIYKSWHDAGTRERHLEGLRKANCSQSFESRREVQIKSYAQNPERRIRASQAAKEVNSRPGVMLSKSLKSTETNLKSWANPEICARRIAGMQGKKRKRRIVQD